MKKEIIQKLDNSVLSVIGSKALQGFEKAHVVSTAINELKSLLTDEYMKPIMALQGNKLGFRTDKDKNGGYPIDVVRNCLIEAVLMGLQPTGNQFNIIAGNTYPTKEGCGYLLNNFEGLTYEIICGLPRINNDKTSASVDAAISWRLNGQDNEKTVPIPIKMDSYTSVDAVIGKATRKARAWLLSRISGVELVDGEVEDVQHKVISTKHKKSAEEHQAERLIILLQSAATVEELQGYKGQFQDDPVQHTIFETRMLELTSNKK
jgi:hypothetical protein